MIRKFKKNTTGRDFVVGDIHGEYQKLMSQLNEICFDFERDRLFAVGDLIDRGEDSLKCLNLIFEPWFFSVKGNHEDLMLESLTNSCKGSLQCWVSNGGEWILDSYNNNQKEYQEVVDLAFSIKELNLLPLAIEIESIKYNRVGIVHADPPLLWDEDEVFKHRQQVLWGRRFIEKKIIVDGIDHVFVGHTPITYSDKPKNFCGNITYLDSGAVFCKERKLFIVEI